MALQSVAHLFTSPNGTTPHRGVRRTLTPLSNVDHLAELRALIKSAQQVERALTQEILAELDASGLDRLAGRHAVAIRDTRTTLQPDPQLFAEAAGARAWEALTVRVEAARRIIAAELLEAISEKTTSPVLRVEALPARPIDGIGGTHG